MSQRHSRGRIIYVSPNYHGLTSESPLLGCFGAAVVDTESEGALEGFLDVGDDTHRGMFVSFQANGEALGILGRKFFALGLNEGSKMFDVCELTVDLNLRCTDIDIDNG